MKHLLLLLLVACGQPRVEPPLAAADAATAGEDPAASAGARGLPISAAAPSFMPEHLTGAHAGKRACPLCVYGNRPQLQLWTDARELDTALDFARAVELEFAKSAQAYIVLAPARGEELAAATLEKVRAAPLEQGFVVRVPSWDDPDTGGLYGHASSDRPALRVYSVVNRRVFARWDDPGSSARAEILASLRSAARYVAEHEITDATIAPEWEPGPRMEVRFRVVDSSGKPVARQKVLAWQTDSEGLYNPRSFGHRVPRLQTTAWTDDEGEIVFRTLFPAPYPGQDEPSHIHFGIETDEKHWRTLWFEGDPLLTPAKREWAERDEETVIVPLDRSATPWRAEHRYVLVR